MNIKFTKKDKTLIIKIDGELDHHISEKIKEAIDKEYEKGYENIIFDFEDLYFMDSSGIGVIIGRYKKAKENGGSIAMVNVSTQLYKIIELSGLLKIIKCFDNIPVALDNM